MLRIDCPKCEGEGWLKDFNSDKSDFEWVECTCDGGRIKAPGDMRVYVNVYLVTRQWGGPEEGNWYFNWFHCIECVPCKNENAAELVEQLEHDYSNLKEGDIYSVLGGQDIAVYVEEKRCESETRERPHYE